MGPGGKGAADDDDGGKWGSVTPVALSDAAAVADADAALARAHNLLVQTQAAVGQAPDLAGYRQAQRRMHGLPRALIPYHGEEGNDSFYAGGGAALAAAAAVAATGTGTAHGHHHHGHYTAPPLEEELWPEDAAAGALERARAQVKAQPQIVLAAVVEAAQAAAQAEKPGKAHPRATPKH